MNESVCIALVVIFVLFLLFTLSSRSDKSSNFCEIRSMEHWRGEYNPVGRGPRGRWDNRSYRSSIQPITYAGTYGGPYYRPVHRYIPMFETHETSVDSNMMNCIEACSTKNGEEYQECLKLCKETYPTFSVV